MRLFLMLFLIMLTFGCATRNVAYNREKVIHKFTPKFDIYLDSEKVNLNNLYLDKDNIKKTIIDKKSKIVWINQIKKTSLIELKKLGLDSLNDRLKDSNKNEFGLVVLDGILLNENEINKIKIDPNSIETFGILTSEDLVNLNWCKGPERSIILIGTK